MATVGRRKIDVLLVRNETRLFSDVLAEALSADPHVELLSRPIPAEAARDVCGKRQPHVVLIEVTDATAESLRTIVQPIKAVCGDAPVVLVADQVIGDTFLVAGLEAGAAGIVDASGGIGEVLSAVRAAVQGKRIVDAERLAAAIEAAARRRERERHRVELLGLLSDREREVLSCLTRGLRNSEIGESLSISTRTVEKHVHHILRKLDVNSRLAAVAVAAEVEDLTYEEMSGTA